LLEADGTPAKIAKLSMPAWIGGPAGAAEEAASLVGAADRVIGHYPEYVQLAEKTGAKFFNIPKAIWSRMSAADRWAANVKFLDRGIAQGATFRLATSLEKVRRGSSLEREISYLLNRGYQFIKDGSALIPK
jgi:hypothetical protein